MATEPLSFCIYHGNQRHTSDLTSLRQPWSDSRNRIKPSACALSLLGVTYYLLKVRLLEQGTNGAPARQTSILETQIGNPAADANEQNN